MNSVSLGETLRVLYANKRVSFLSPVVKGTVLERTEETETGHEELSLVNMGVTNFAGYPGWHFNEIYSFSPPPQDTSSSFTFITQAQESCIIYYC